MSNIYITDRTSSDCQRIHTLYAKLLSGTATSSEKAEWNAGMKGSLNTTDLSRLADILDDLKSQAEATGSFNPFSYTYTPSTMKSWNAGTKITKQLLYNYLIANASTLKTAIVSSYSLPTEIKLYSDLNLLESFLENAEELIQSAPSVVDGPTNLTPSYYYNGTEFTNGYTYDSTKISMTGSDRGTAVGTYVATYTPINGYVWRGTLTTDPITVTLTVNQNTAVGDKPTSPSAVTYTGSTITNGYTTPEHVTMTGYNSGINVGSYVAYYTPDTGYSWSDYTSDTVAVTLTINVRTLTIPSLATTTYNYTGSLITPTVSNFNSTYENQSGNSSATTGGTYTITWSLSNTTNTKWSDGTVSNKSATWTLQYVWTKWNVITTYTDTETEVSGGSGTVIWNYPTALQGFGNFSYTWGSTYTFNTSTGKFAITSGTKTTPETASQLSSGYVGSYPYASSLTPTTFDQIVTGTATKRYASGKCTKTSSTTYTAIIHTATASYSKGTTQYANVTSTTDSSAYPSNGKSGDYWYVKTW